MKSRILIYSLIAFFAIGCSSDPCDEPLNLECLTGDADNDGIINGDDTAPLDPCLPNDNLACLTGDLDGDGVVNSEDTDPLDACVPNVPSFEKNIIGTWSWSAIGGNGIVQFNADRTYVDIENELVSNGDVVERTWFAVDNDFLDLSVVNSNGSSASASFILKSYDCDVINFEGFIVDVVFTRQ